MKGSPNRFAINRWIKAIPCAACRVSGHYCIAIIYDLMKFRSVTFVWVFLSAIVIFNKLIVIISHCAETLRASHKLSSAPKYEWKLCWNGKNATMSVKLLNFRTVIRFALSPTEFMGCFMKFSAIQSAPEDKCDAYNFNLTTIVIPPNGRKMRRKCIPPCSSNDYYVNDGKWPLFRCIFAMLIFNFSHNAVFMWHCRMRRHEKI